MRLEMRLWWNLGLLAVESARQAIYHVRGLPGDGDGDYIMNSACALARSNFGSKWKFRTVEDDGVSLRMVVAQ
jgi:hypothetical protein